MEQFVEESMKRRLIEPVDMITAINILKSHGYWGDELFVAITRIFYVDLDTLNEVMRRH
ncbi:MULTISPECIES: hypothetical protein [Hyphomicrobiales]|uniref:hypothetical protein n=1 Tax=Hyphomicrobiales TaxID=356 RepID=UPI00037CCBD6|nr:MULTISPECIES: hypothetical protein [Phyllobacteriaceae]MCX8568302.1 hypothetical protein [Aminobacter sp. MET-1]